ncbi:MAG: putative monovalent cation/H+ antiporter subunit A [Anaerolineales bacterium]
MLLAVLIGFALAPFAPFIVRLTRPYAAWVMALLPLGLTAYFASRLMTIQDGTVLVASYDWAPSLGVDLLFRLDGLSMLFALIISGVGTAVFLYGGGYLHHHPHLGRFYVYISIFMAAMLGLVLTDNIIMLFVFWELTSISSYWLISFYHDKEASREAAKQALIVTGAGGLTMLAGLIMLGTMADSWQISTIVQQTDLIHAHELYVPALVLILIGAFTKSAQFPFHFWLPGAMEAPAPVSAYLHSATMVKAGIYLMARLHQGLAGTPEWELLVTGIGGITMLVGGYVAWQQTDVKRILAYTTVSGLGIITFLLGIGTELAVKGALLFLLVHSLYKGALFMVGGTLDHETGTRDITHMGGLFRAMPFTAIAAAVAALSMAGLPPLLGFIGKEIIYEATLEAAHMPIILLTGVAVLGNLFNVTAAGLVAITPFYGEEGHTPEHPHRAPLSMWLSPMVLGGFSLALGLFSVTLFEPLLKQAVFASFGHAEHIKLGLFHGLTPMLGLSVVTVLGGALLFVAVGRLRVTLAPVEALAQRIGPANLYKLGLQGILNLADAESRFILRPALRQYIRVIIFTFILLVGFEIYREVDINNLIGEVDLRAYELLLAVLISVAALVCAHVESRLGAVMALGVVGYSIAVVYMLYGAPDLAMTQFAIETLTVVLFVLVIYRLPKFKAFSKLPDRLIDATIAGAFGIIMTLFTLVVISRPFESRLSPFFAENAYLEAHGRNVVNVILVDFRGFDTMGEITVLALAALGVFALLRLNLNPDAPTPTGQASTEDDPEHGENR